MKPLIRKEINGKNKVAFMLYEQPIVSEWGYYTHSFVEVKSKSASQMKFTVQLQTNQDEGQSNGNI